MCGPIQQPPPFRIKYKEFTKLIVFGHFRISHNYYKERNTDPMRSSSIALLTMFVGKIHAVRLFIAEWPVWWNNLTYEVLNRDYITKLNSITELKIKFFKIYYKETWCGLYISLYWEHKHSWLTLRCHTMMYKHTLLWLMWNLIIETGKRRKYWEMYMQGHVRLYY